MEDVYSKGGVCSPDVLDENEVHMGSLDLAFGRTKKQGNKAKLWGFRSLVVKVTAKCYISINFPLGIWHPAIASTLVAVAGSNQITPVQVSLI